jgi:hypothetical protein
MVGPTVEGRSEPTLAVSLSAALDASPVRVSAGAPPVCDCVDLFTRALSIKPRKGYQKVMAQGFSS